MAYTTIDDPSAHFHTHLYTGNNSNRSETNDANAGDFQPDWVWIKARSETKDHRAFDSTRGATKVIYPSLTNAEGTTATSLTSFDSDGFSLGSSDGINKNTITYVAWQWKANGGTTSTNTAGTNIDTTVQANTTAGFSIVTYTGTGSAATLGHGLGSSPEVVIAKSRSQAYSWIVYHKAAASDAHTDYLGLDDADALIDFPMWNDTAPTSTVFSVGTDVAVNNNTKNFVAYCFKEIQGYSKFGSYTGNGSLDGPFVYLGFKPAWVLIKQTSTTQNWILYDNKINPFNEAVTKLSPNLSNAEDSSTGNNDIDMLSNGFKVTEDNNDMNESGQTFIYMAFAEHPFVSSEGVPVTAR